MKNLKKFFALALILALVLGIQGIALGEKVTQVSFGGSSSGGVMYYMAGAFSNSVTPKTPGINISNVTTGAAVDNAIKVSQGELDLGITYSSLVYEAAQGTGNFADPSLAALAKENLMGVGKAYDSDFYIVVYANSGINSIEDLNGKTVACGNPGSGAQYIADMVLDAFKIDCKREYLAFSDTTYAMKEGRIQAVCQAGSPSGAVTELSETESIKILPFTVEQIDELKKISPFFFAAEMPVGRYKGVDEPVLLPHFRNYVIATKALDADVLYKMLEVAFQEDVLKELVAGHRNWAQFAEDTAAFEALGLKVHPGAVKFFEEHPEAPRAY